MDREVNETLSTYVKRLEETETSFQNGLLLSRNVVIPILLDGVDNKVIKTPIAWPLIDYKMFYIVDVPAGTNIPSHAHDEDIFRILIDGDLNINGIDINIGEWFVIEAGKNYSISTKNGYKSLSGYVKHCRTNRMSELHLERSK